MASSRERRILFSALGQRQLYNANGANERRWRHLVHVSELISRHRKLFNHRSLTAHFIEYVPVGQLSALDFCASQLWRRVESVAFYLARSVSGNFTTQTGRTNDGGAT